MLSEISRMFLGLSSVSGGSGMFVFGVVTIDAPVVLGGLGIALPGIVWAVRTTWALQAERTRMLIAQEKTESELKKLANKMDTFAREQTVIRERIGRLEGRQSE